MIKAEDDLIDDIGEYKVYNEKVYNNSDREPLGVSINGKTKEYLGAHEAIRNMMKLGRKYIIKEGEMKIVDVKYLNAMVNVVIDVTKDGGNKGRVELKIHNPSARKRGATLELRKMSGFEYKHVHFLKNIINILLDGFIMGKDLNDIVKTVGRQNSSPWITSKPKLFTCDKCNFETRFAAALKTHKTKIHENDVPVSNKFECDLCEYKFIQAIALEGHKVAKHAAKKRTKSQSNNSSPSSSPPRKRENKTDTHTTQVEEPVEMMDIQIEANAVMKTMLESRIEQLEFALNNLEKEKKNDELEITRLKKEVIHLESKIKSNDKIRKPNKFVSPVQEEHLEKLQGYKLKFTVKGDGACATNSFAVAVHEDDNEGENVKRKVLNHIADNFDNYYINKMALPYVETVGVGNASYRKTLETPEELKTFFRSDEALKIYSNCHELLGLANLYNVKIKVFTYGGPFEDRWSIIHPDADLVSKESQNLGRFLPDVALYHMFETHYDLLVEDDSRIAVLGLLAGSANDDSNKVDDSLDVKKELWTTVTKKTNKSEKKEKKNNVGQNEKLITETEDLEANHKDIEEEIILLGMKNAGHKRTGPQEAPELASGRINNFSCDKCGLVFKFNSHLQEHLKTHTSKTWTCTVCGGKFDTKTTLESHMVDEHTMQVESDDEWSCNDCPFQGNCASELMTHLKFSAHQPSINVKDKRRVFRDYKQCYTCKMDFDGFHNLMSHRNKVHPSNKQCKKYADGFCPRDEKECWYVHRDENYSKSMFENFKCGYCDKTLIGRNNFMSHKKTNHPADVQNCEQFMANKCTRSESECWFKHEGSKKQNQNQVFQEPLENIFPPETSPPSARMMEMMNKLYKKVQKMEEKFEEMLS